MANLTRTIGSKAALFLTCGLLLLTAADQALAWGAGGGGGGGGKKVHPLDPSPKMVKLRDLTKRLRGELKFDNQKSQATQTKEYEQTQEMKKILDGLPQDSTDPDIREAKNVLDQWAESPTSFKYR